MPGIALQQVLVINPDLFNDRCFMKILLSASFFLLISLHASALQLDKEYRVFDGKPVNLQKVIGHQPVYIKFWATWCLECRQELPSLQKTYEQYKSKIAIYAVNLNINETDEFIRALKEKNKLTLPIVMDNNGSIASNFQFYGTPFHALLNAKGELVYSSYKDDDALKKELEKLSQSVVKKDSEKPVIGASQKTISEPAGISMVYFSAAWCDWYMKDIHPGMSKNCINATHALNQLHQENSNVPLKAYVTYLWTEPKDLDEYLKKYAIAYKVDIDQENKLARHYQVTQYPSLLILKDGKEVKRFDRFDNPHLLKQALVDLGGDRK
jgi:thiol-disulfide isomerase/thioredoxin